MQQSDTIAAIATASGKGGIGIVRISGASALDIGRAICATTLTPRHAHYVTFSDSSSAEIDQGIALYFPAPHSFTGEDVVELQAHGSAIVLDRILEAALSLGARLARPGEFSERAFLNDKIDLVQAEAIADIIDSHSQVASRSALKSLRGDFSARINALADELVRLRTYIEAAIDFPEEEIDFISDSHVAESLQAALDGLEAVFASARRGSLLNRGLNVLILGSPNAGKSSLLNALAGGDRAIVTSQPGTTRDVLRESIELDGLPLNIIDTAGLRSSTDEIEQEGIRRAASEIATADIVLYTQDISARSLAGQPGRGKLLEELSTYNIELPEKTLLAIVNNKIDLVNLAPDIKIEQGLPVIWLSARQELGIELLAGCIRDFFELESTTENTFTARRRHLDCLQRAQDLLLHGRAQLEQHQAGELLAEDLRQAHDALGEITGKVIADDLLGEIFSSFCIGK